jgi:hypothetical protein
MSAGSIAARAYDSFFKWCSETSPSASSHDEERSCLADYIRDWVESGIGVRACLGDFQTFLIATTSIIDRWHKQIDDGLLDYAPAPDDDPEALINEDIIERRVERILPFGYSVHEILDLDWFTECVFNELHGRRD